MPDDLPLLEVERWLNASRPWRQESLDDLVDAFEMRMDAGANLRALRRHLVEHESELRFFAPISNRMYCELLRTIAWECMQ